MASWVWAVRGGFRPPAVPMKERNYRAANAHILKLGGKLLYQTVPFDDALLDDIWATRNKEQDARNAKAADVFCD